MTINGATYDYPETGDQDWGPDATDWAQAVTTGMLQKAGGLFQLLADVDFGTGFGVKSLYYKTRTANGADAGQVRLARADVINWRNQANDGNLSLGVSATDTLQFNGTDIQSNALAQNHIFVGSAGGAATDVAMSGDATIVSSGALTIAANVVTNAKLATVATATFKGRTTAGTGNVEDLTATQATALLNAFVGDGGSGGTKGLVPAPTTGDASKFLKGDGTWSDNAGGDVVGPGSATDNAVARFDSTTGKLIQNSVVTISDAGSLAGVVNIVMTGALTGATQGAFGNINIQSNEISSTNGNGNIDLNPNGTGQVRSQKRHLFNGPVQYGETIDTTTTSQDVALPATSNIKYQNASLTAIRSIGAGSSGNQLQLFNDTGATITIKNQDSGATAANRINTGTGADIELSDGAGLQLYYDTNDTRWRVIGGAGGVDVTTIITNWASYTPTLGAGYGTTANVNFKWRRVGDSMEIMGSFEAGTVSGSPGTFTLPGGATVDSAKLSLFGNRAIVGSANTSVGSGGDGIWEIQRGVVVVADSSDYTKLFFGNVNTGDGGATVPNLAAGNTFLNNNSQLQLTCKIPIVGWSAFTIATESPLYQVTDWATWTPTFTGFGTVSNVNMQWRRDGSDMLVQGYWQNGTLGSNQASFTLPNSLQVKSSFRNGSSVRQNYGVWYQWAGTNYIYSVDGIAGALVNQSSNDNQIMLVARSGTGEFFNDNSGTWTGSNNWIYVNGRIPIEGWNNVEIPASAIFNSGVYVSGDNGHGSVGTAIRCFDGADQTNGTDITYTQDTTNGDYFTINATGNYAMMWWDRWSGSVNPFGFSKNQADLTQGPLNIAWPTELIHVRSFMTQGDGLSATAYLQAGDVVRCNDGGAANNSTVPYMSIVRVS